MDDLKFTLEELQHMMVGLNAASEPTCQVCQSVRSKLEVMIANETRAEAVEPTGNYEREVSDEYRALGVTKWEVIQGPQE